ncbi:hypothetical protein AVEN_57876-1 [Araneus ventricosus]|uniref:Uncharacterized protein n=1 Tax=Araneus ventricosus TaxID=182803 RepID=A0A4Y2L1K6_ARAVE|nr:hypothetical protein AVEN_57876-1 [Araneus ventricosus]
MNDISVQTNVEKFQMTKDAETITDKFVCGDNERVELKTDNSAPPILGDLEITGTNPSSTDITFDRIPLLLYQGENEETPEIDPESFEVDEPELIEIFQNSKISFSSLDNPCPHHFSTNPFLVTNPFELKKTNAFKRLSTGITNPFYGVLDDDKISVRSTSVSRKKVISLPVISRSKLSLKRNVKQFKSWIKSRRSVNNSLRYTKLN